MRNCEDCVLERRRQNKHGGDSDPSDVALTHTGRTSLLVVRPTVAEVEEQANGQQLLHLRKYLGPAVQMLSPRSAQFACPPRPPRRPPLPPPQVVVVDSFFLPSGLCDENLIVRMLLEPLQSLQMITNDPFHS